MSAGSYDAAWEALFSATMGSRSMRECSPTADGVEWPKPIHVMDDVRALGDFTTVGSNEERGRRVEEIYSHFVRVLPPEYGRLHAILRFRGAWGPSIRVDALKLQRSDTNG